jgi:hypothetical protein
MSDSTMVPTGRKRSLLVQLLKFASLGFSALLLLALAAWVFENWRGARAWDAFRAEWESKGERFDIAASKPPPVPDEQNFALTPLLAPMLDYHRPAGRPVQWRDSVGKDLAQALGQPFKNSGGAKVPPLGQWQSATFADLEAWRDYFAGNTNFPFARQAKNPAQDVLTALGKFGPELDELGVAARTRPQSVFPIHYEETFSALLPHLATLKGLSQIVRLRAVARLSAGQKAEALQDVELCLRLAESVKNEPTLISQLVRIAIIQMGMQPIWEGLARHEWSEEQLARLQSMLANSRILEDYGRTIRGERALGNAAIEDLKSGRMPMSALDEGPGITGGHAFLSRFIPGGWYRLNQVTLNRLFQERSIPLVDAGKHRVYVEQTNGADEAPVLKEFGIHNVFARLLFPAMSKCAMKFANAQTTLDLAVVACALERHRLANGSYPEQLDPLVPRYMAKIPTDVISGDLLHYHRTSPNQFVLYSIGWNQTDDGGDMPVRKPGNTPDPKDGDWAWRYEAQ